MRVAELLDKLEQFSPEAEVKIVSAYGIEGVRNLVKDLPGDAVLVLESTPVWPGPVAA